MAWGPFSSEAVTLSEEVRRLHIHGRTSEAVDLVERALANAYTQGPSNKTYEEFIHKIYEDEHKQKD